MAEYVGIGDEGLEAMLLGTEDANVLGGYMRCKNAIRTSEVSGTTHVYGEFVGVGALTGWIMGL